MHLKLKGFIAPALFIFLCILISLYFYHPSQASENKSTAFFQLTDEAGLLTRDQHENLEEKGRAASEANGIGIYIIIMDEIAGTRKSWLEDYYDSQVYDVSPDAALLLINMDPSDRGLEIQGYGQCEFNLSDDRIESLLDQIVPYLQSEDYGGAAAHYIEQVNYYMELGPATNYKHTQADNDNYNENYYEDKKKDKLLGKTLRNLLLGIAAGAITVGVMAYHSGGRITTSQGTYLSESDSRILGRWDRYIRTTTTRRPKPKQDNSSGSSHSGGGGGVSSGGHSHSGGGRSF